MSKNAIVMKEQPKTINYPLKACPFCGSPAQLRLANLFVDTGYRACCASCGTGTTLVIVGQYINYRGEYNKTFTDDEAAAEAARIWNERTEVSQ